MTGETRTHASEHSIHKRSTYRTIR